jgi:hypothetical protein
MALMVLVLSCSFATVASIVALVGFDTSWGAAALLYFSLALVPMFFMVIGAALAGIHQGMGCDAYAPSGPENTNFPGSSTTGATRPSRKMTPGWDALSVSHSKAVEPT